MEPKELQERISALTGKYGALFVLALCRRQRANFLLWCSLEKERYESERSFKKCFDYLTTAILGDSSEKGLEARREDLKLLSEAYDNDLSFGGERAADAVATLELGYEILMDENDEACFEAANLSMGATFARVLVENPGLSEDEILKNELVRDEFASQLELVSAVEQIEKSVSSKPLKAPQVKELLELSVRQGVSNIGLADFNEDEV